ncbi:hypothetical protein ABB02_00124 [Clostridiaceae bacterium JG1575]|nr:hypothetical protein ABB02_00124 [Clostridiaceae bacterium JG1575]
MKHAKIITLCLSLSLIAAVGCQPKGKTPDKTTKGGVTVADTKPTAKDQTKPAEAGDKESSLAMWAGSWKTYAEFLKDPMIKPQLERRAALEKVSLDELMKKMDATYKSEFTHMEIEGKKISLYNGSKDQGGKLLFAADYDFMKKEVVKGDRHDTTWYLFETKDPKATIKVFALMPEHGTTMPHIHFRYGDASIVNNLKGGDWWPTFVRTKVTAQDAITSMKDRLDKQEAEAKKDTKPAGKADEKDMKAIAEWAGEWNNMGDYLDRPELQNAFGIAAKKENKSAEDFKKAYVAKRKTDYSKMIIRDKEVLFKDKDGKELGKGTYEGKGKVTSKLGRHDLTWYVFQGDEKALYKTLLVMPVHGDGLIHFHLRYGNEDAQALLKKDNWFPTMVKPDATTAQLIEEITE